MSTTPSPLGNHIVAELPNDVKLSFLSQLELTRLCLGMVVYEAGEQPSHVYFPIDAVVALVLVMESGSCPEVSIVGNDGMVGITAILGGGRAPNRAVVQSAGWAYRLSVSDLQQQLQRHPILMQSLLRYVQVVMAQISQISGCNRHHSIEQRLCRWLLLVHDRLAGDHLRVTQELIASGLGVRREGITVAVGQLQRLSILECARGNIHVLDRRKLELMSCECYRAIKFQTNRSFAQAHQTLDAA